MDIEAKWTGHSGAVDWLDGLTATCHSVLDAQLLQLLAQLVEVTAQTLFLSDGSPHLLLLLL